MDSLREWFDSACQDHCNGHNNLYTPQLTCLDHNTGIIVSVVHHEGEISAQMLIDLAIADIKARKSQVVHLSHGWILHLNLTSPTTKQPQLSSNPSNKSQSVITEGQQPQLSSNSRNKSQPAIIGVSLGAAIAAVTVLLILVGVAFVTRKRSVYTCYWLCYVITKYLAIVLFFTYSVVL